MSGYKQIECSKEKDLATSDFVQTQLSNNGKDGSNRDVFDRQPAFRSLSVMTSHGQLVDIALMVRESHHTKRS